MKKKVVFIVSAGHSGSSLLALILGSHPKIFSAGELKGLPNRYRRNLYIDCVNKDSKFWVDSFGNDGLQSLALSLSGKRVHPWIPLKIEKWVRGFMDSHDPITNPYSFMFSKLPQEIIVDSSKALPWIQTRLCSREFVRQQLDAHLIYLIRDGRAVVNSFSRKYPHKDFAELSKDWTKKHLEKSSFFSNFDANKKLQVKYEELASKPAVVAKNICDFLGVDFYEDMVSYWKYPHHDISGNDGTYSLINKYKALTSEHFEARNDIEYYEKMGLSIRLDLRWKRELSEEKIAIFNQVAGEINKPYEWD